MCENYLLSLHEGDILCILEDSDKDKYFSVNLNFLELFESDTNLGNTLLTDPESSLKSWNEAVFNVQNNLIKENDNKKWTLKNNVNCRIYSLPPWPHVCKTIFPGNDDANKFVQVTGTVVRMSARKLLEYQRQYICTKCKYPITVEAKYDKRNIIKQPKKCTNPEGCTGKNIITFGELDPYNCKDYQEIKIQEDLSKMGIGTVPGHMVVTLEDDLVNACKPGENVTITGIVKRRWCEFDKGVKITVDIVLKANHIQVNNSSGLSIAVSDDMKQFFDNFWMKYQHDPLVGRNIILKSISPEIYGRQLVKLAIAIVLAGGGPNEESQSSTGIDTRSESHLLLVGDPGTGKSQMLRFASRIMPRSVLTTGVGSTAAGLTVTAIMENGEWQLEAGALVMADGGICCIDEFNSMREHDRTSIHEAMEQQTISVAKAGMVCKLKTRCSILAACNPKGNIDPSQPLCVNVAMSSPLLSRFDLILLLRDIVNEENDRKLAEYLSDKSLELSGEGVFWGLEKLQAYYAVIKKENPKLTAEGEIILSTYYQLQRKFGSRNKSRTTVRLLESLIRLSQGHAKLIYHKEVQVIDTIFAIILVDAALDYESSLFNLNIDYDSFFDNPKRIYWDLLENILGKLNLDYIYQFECEKVGVNIKKTSQDTHISVNRSQDDAIAEVGDLSVRSQNAVSSTPKRTPLFTQRRPQHGHSDFNKTSNLSQGGSQINKHSDSGLNKPQFLFSQRCQNKSEIASDHSKNKSTTQASQSISEIIDNSNQSTSTQSGSKLLFSQRFSQIVQEKGAASKKTCSEKDPNKKILSTSTNLVSAKSSKDPSTVRQNISNDSGNISHSTQDSNTFSQNRLNLTQDRNINKNFTIYQNKNDSFLRKKVPFNLEEASSSKRADWSGNRNNCSGNASNRFKNIPDNPGFSKSNKGLTIMGGSETKKIKLSEIVKSSSSMDFDFDSCFANIKTNSTKTSCGISKKNSDSLNLDKAGEESGFGTQSRNDNRSDFSDSFLKISDAGVAKNDTIRNFRSPVKETNTNANESSSEIDSNHKTQKKRPSNSPSKGKKKSKIHLNHNEFADETNLLNLMPSVNDEFMKYNLNIDWDMQGNNEQDLSDKTDDVENNDINKGKCKPVSYLSEKRKNNLNTDDKMKSGTDSCRETVIDKVSGQGDAKTVLKEDMKEYNKNSAEVVQKLEVEKKNQNRKSVEDLLAQFEFVPREKRAIENKNIDKVEKETRSNREDNVQNPLSGSKEAKEINKDLEGEENNDPDIILSQNVPQTTTRFKFANKSIGNKFPSFFENPNIDSYGTSNLETAGNSSGSSAKLETKKIGKPSLKTLISNIDLDEEIRNFDSGSSIKNPFSRVMSNLSCKSISKSERGEYKEDISSDKLNDSRNIFLAVDNTKKDGSTAKDKIKTGSKSGLNFDHCTEMGDVNDANTNNKVGEKHELYDLSQNSKKEHIWNKFSCKKLDIKRMPSCRSNSSDL